MGSEFGDDEFLGEASGRRESSKEAEPDANDIKASSSLANLNLERTLETTAQTRLIPGVSFFVFGMPDRPDWPDADTNEGDEAAAERAYVRLLEHLQRLEPDLGGVSVVSRRKRGYAAKRRAAILALQRHAQIIISEFAFIDGDRVNHSDARLLNTFHADPKDGAAARYCWALLHGPAASLREIVSAVTAEYEAFSALQFEGMKVDRGPSEPPELTLAENGHRKRANRLAYRVLALQRQLLVVRHVAGAQSETSKQLEREIVEATGAEEKAAQILRQIELKRIAASRGGSGL